MATRHDRNVFPIRGRPGDRIFEMSNQQLYDQDFYAWTHEQAGLLRAGRLSEADVEHIAEEIESIGKREKRELVSRLRVLLLHLLKWQYQPTCRGASWEGSIINTRDELDDHLRDNPSLKSQIAGAMEVAYRRAVVDATTGTDLPKSTFPRSCAWTYDEIMDPDFWPDSPLPCPPPCASSS
jgi:hypothetical protein